MTINKTKWQHLRDSVGTLLNNKNTTLKQDVGPLTLSSKIRSIMVEFNAEKIAPLKTAVYKKYDPAHDGKAVLYTRPFEKLRAIFRGERAIFADFTAWRENRGILFPNLRAWWHGHMTFGQLLFGGATKGSIIITEKGRTDPAPTTPATTDTPSKTTKMLTPLPLPKRNKVGTTCNKSLITQNKRFFQPDSTTNKATNVGKIEGQRPHNF